MPLRKPEEYRADSGKLLQWLSRRWLYNIPRSLETEGLRPLGRLALVDHGVKLRELLRSHLTRIAEPARRRGIRRTDGLEMPRSAPTRRAAVVDLRRNRRRLRD